VALGFGPAATTTPLGTPFPEPVAAIPHHWNTRNDPGPLHGRNRDTSLTSAAAAVLAAELTRTDPTLADRLQPILTELVLGSTETDI
jgi:hypothetical protein